MNLSERRDGITDPVLAGAMAELRDETPYEVDWDRLRRSINDRAALPLARRRAHRRSLASRSFVPVGIAATVLFALAVGPSLYERVFEGGAIAEYVAAVDDELLVQALTGDHSEEELLRMVTGSPEVLLAVAIGTR